MVSMIEKTLTLKLTYDPEVDSAYLYLDRIDNDEVVEALSCGEDSDLLPGDLNLDLDKEGHLKGIEIVGASRILPRRLLD
jgi:uncharacterized protein YuzE